MLAQGYTFLFNLDAQLLFDTVLLAVAVFFLFMLMSYLLFNPARKLLKDRQDRIESDINTAVADKESAAALKAEYEGKLKDIDKEAEAILTEARQKALKNQNKIVDDAKEEASRIIKRAREEAELEKKHAMDDMKQEMIQIAISIHLSVYVPLIRSYMYNVKMRKMSIINLFMPWKSSLKHFVRWPESLIAY